MVSRLSTQVVYFACCAMSAALSPRAGASEVPIERVQFEYTGAAAQGQAFFICGSAAQLGCGDMRRAVKMVRDEAATDRWFVNVGIPQGTAYTYQVVMRDPGAARLGDPANGTVVSALLNGATAQPDPPTRDRVVYTLPAEGAAEVSFSTAAAPVDRPLVPLPQEQGFDLAMLINRPSGTGMRASILGTEFQTPLHRVLFSNGEAYNYLRNPGSTLDGTIYTRNIASQYVSGTRTINGVRGRGFQVLVPRGYLENTWRRYPVLYMHDGQNVFGDGANGVSWHAEVAAGALIASARCRETILVAIDYSDYRLGELNPDWEGDATLNRNYNRFLSEELIPYINANFRTLTGPENTGILGSSFGGIASISAVLELPGTFGHLGAMSTSFWATNIRNRIVAGEIPDSVRVYLDAGDMNDGGDDAMIARDGLIRTGRYLEDSLYFEIGFNQDHSEEYWAIRLYDALEALFPITDEQNLIDLPVLPRGDVNADGCVDMTDLTRMLAGFGFVVGEPGYDPYADVDGSNAVDVGDVVTVLANYGMQCP